jgi:geranylgeranyl diphosphate synthase type II
MTRSLDRLERALKRAVSRLTEDGCPSQLRDAVRYAVFPAGNRLRPRLCYAVAEALGDDRPELADAGATALELLHCASLVQDDLPIFDNATERRGRPALHQVFGEATAILAADALIIGAFETLAWYAAVDPERARHLTRTITRGVGTPHGAVAGQAWESEAEIDLEQYHRAKTAALFESATAAGAIAAGHDPEPWRTVGTWLGRAYQVADDLADEASIGRGSDAALGRPNAAHQLGVPRSVALLEQYITSALDAVPLCPGRVPFQELLQLLAAKFRHVALGESSVPTAERWISAAGGCG